jgi:type II secretory pathway pseudopilin PulG
MTNPSPARVGGFALLEVILALALFSVVAVSMSGALNQVAQASRSVRLESRVMRTLESLLAEAAHQHRFTETTRAFPPNDQGVAATLRVERMPLRSREGNALDGIFRITAEAWFVDGTEHALRRRMETWAMSPPETR